MSKSAIDTLLTRMQEFAERPAMHWRGQEISYSDLIQRIDGWHRELKGKSLEKGAIIVVHGDYTPTTCSLIFA